MPGPKITTAFEVRIDAPATPERVAEAAQMIASMFRAAGQFGDNSGITMEVFNRNLRAVIHPRSSSGRKAASQVAQFIAEPIKSARRNPALGQEIAATVVEHRKFLTDHKAVVIIQKRDEITETPLDKPFLDSLRGLSQAEINSDSPIMGETEEFSPILRVGKISHDQPDTARIMVNGSPMDVPFLPSLRSEIFKLAESEQIAKLRLEVAWNPSSLFDVLTKKCKIIDAAPFSEISGSDFMSKFAELAKTGPILSRPVEEIIADLEEGW